MLTVENFTARFVPAGHGQDAPPVVAGVSFSLAAGESLGLIGESGCGKTTLALGLMRLLRGASVSGRVSLQGRDLLVMPEGELRRVRWRQIAIVFQNALEVFNPVLTIAEQLTEPLLTHLQLSPAEARERVEEMLALTGLASDWLHAYPHQLSGGMRQQALLAMALACQPELLIVDEPTTSLDPDSCRKILAMLERLQERLGFATIMISHQLPAISRFTRRLLTMYAGRIVEEGPTAEVLRHPLHPYTRGLINASPDFLPYKDLWGIPGEPPQPGAVRGCAFSPRCCQSGDVCRQQLPATVELAEGRRVTCHKKGIEVILAAQNIHKRFSWGSQEVPVLQGLDLHVHRGEVVALVGASGSGKSTLAQILVRMLAADQGRIYFAGRLISSHAATASMGGMQLVLQDPGEAVSHRLSVLAAVREPLDILCLFDLDERNRRAIACLAAVYLPTAAGFLQQTCHGLSGGQRQRVAIARALVTEPVVLIADEITAMLDPSTRAVILRELKGLQHQRGFAMLFISHDLHLARKIADRIYVLGQGRIIREGAVFDVFSDTAGQLPQKQDSNGHTHVDCVPAHQSISIKGA